MKAHPDILKRDVLKSLENLKRLRRGNKHKTKYVVLATAALSALTVVVAPL